MKIKNKKFKTCRFHNGATVRIHTNAFGFHKYETATIVNNIKFIKHGTWCVYVKKDGEVDSIAMPTKYIHSI